MPPSRRAAPLASAFVALCLAATVGALPPLSAQALIQGRLHARDDADPTGRDGEFPLSAILAVGSLPGADTEAISFRTWETHPTGWFRLSGLVGPYALAFTSPAHFARPMILTNQSTRDGDSLDLRLHGSFDFACFHDRAWDPRPARGYLQPFIARGTSITSVGFKLATDGVDGVGPGAQDIVVSIHRRTDAPPSEWSQIGPAMLAPNVDCGGPKSYWYSVGWSSGEVPVEPGAEYAVGIRPATSGGVVQFFWRPRRGGSPGVYRIADDDSGFVPSDLWLAVASDGDGLVIPYAKRVRAKFPALTNLESRWSQTWIAQGRGLASIVLYAAVSGKQPPLSRQRARVRVRSGGPDGDVVGTEKIAVGNGDYTGDASWGHFVAVFAPGEVPLEPGATYALELESIETLHTVGGFVDIKGQVSDGRAGFNPYRKHPADDYPHGTAYRRGTEAQDFDLDLEIVEYEHARADWATAVRGRELLEDRVAEISGEPGWTPFRIDEGTALTREIDGGTTFLRVAATVDADGGIGGGWRQRIDRLERRSTFRVSGLVRCSWPPSVDHASAVGIDATGQTEDPDAATIEWTGRPPRHGEFFAFTSRPVRPKDGSISIWLRGRCAKEDARFPFRADFAALSVRRVDDGVPTTDERTARRGFIRDVSPEAEGAREARRALVRERRAHVPVLVHRGASRFAPENTLEAYAAAMDRGADGFEIDIRRSSDGVLYTFHDDTFDRMTDLEGAVRGKSYFDLLGAEVGDDGKSRIPTLAAVFTLARDRGALLHLDVKEPGIEPEILRLIEAADLWEHIVHVNDYNAASIRADERIVRLAYKGWFPPGQSDEDVAPDELAPARRAFLEQPGDMVFTRDDPLDAVGELGRNAGDPVPVPEALRAWWEEGGRR